VVLHGLQYFCHKLPSYLQHDRWEVIDRSGHRPLQLLGTLRELSRCDLVYTWGGRISMGKFLWAARGLRKKKVVMLWSGSDVLFAKRELAGGLQDSWIFDKIHWGVSPWVVEEVRSMGLPCEHVQTYFMETAGEAAPLPAEFSVLLYVADAKKADLYGWDLMVEVAQKLPHVSFQLCGLPEDQSLSGPANIKIHKWMPNLSSLMEKSAVYYRPARHDGLSFTVLEALAAGRHVLYSYPLTGCLQTTTVSSACAEISRLQEQHQSGELTLNRVGQSYVSQLYAPEIVRSELFRRWENIILS
jgi:hypothetical protein